MNKNVATVLSFLVCGLGQIYKGFVLKGIILFLSFIILCGLGRWSYIQIIDTNYTYSAALEEVQIALDSSPTEEEMVGITNSLNNLKEELKTVENKLLFYRILMIVFFICALLTWFFNIYDANKINNKKEYKEENKYENI